MTGRNDPCPCGSGLKFKKCCADKVAARPTPAGRLQAAATLFRHGDADAAVALCDELLRDDGAALPGQTLHQLGLLAAGARRHATAVALLRAAAQRQPDDYAIAANLGNALVFAGQPAAALAALDRAIALKPQAAECHNSRGNVLGQLGRAEESAAACRRAVELRPDYVEAWSNLGTSLAELGRNDAAEQAWRTCLSLDPGYFLGWNGLGLLLKAAGRPDEAADCLERAIALRPDYAEAHNNLGNVRKDQGRLDAALAAYARCLQIRPDHHVAQSNRLLCLNYLPGVSPEQLLAEHRAWEARHAAPFHAQWPRHDVSADPERQLRVGFLSPDLRAHAVAQFLLPLLESHDRDGLRISCYSCSSQVDATSRRIAAAAAEWVDCYALDDAALAGRIAADRIDILVDLAGHTANNRLRVMARKPAPVQATWLGYLSTTGLAAIDWRIVDVFTAPPQADAVNAERLARLPHAQWCYDPPAAAPEVGPLPALAAGHLSFASINAFQKVNDDVLELWARLLLAVPDSRLLVLGVAATAQARLRQFMAARGVAPERLELLARLPREAYYAAIGRADVALDPFPFSGATTTCDALWMGLPVITLPGRTETSRSTGSILTTLGLDSWIASDEAAYVAIGRDAAAGLAELAALRDGLRQRMRATPVADGSAFARSFETLLRGMWRDWCGSRPEK